MIPILDNTIKDELTNQLIKIEQHFDGEVAFYYGAIEPGVIKIFRDFIERIAGHRDKKELLVFFLNTPGGSVESAEKMVEIIRFHFDKVYFVVPDFALSAGTILCMSGDGSLSISSINGLSIKPPRARKVNPSLRRRSDSVRKKLPRRSEIINFGILMGE